MPQRGSRKKVAKRRGVAVRKAGRQCKDTVTVTMTWDLSGFNYGPQIVTKRKEITDDLAVVGPRGARQFDDSMDVVAMQSHHCLISRTAEGMQTETSFHQFLQSLSKQIDQRSAAEVAAGGTAIERPVVLMLDNHASRYGDAVLKSATGHIAMSLEFACSRRSQTRRAFSKHWINTIPSFTDCIIRRAGRTERHTKRATQVSFLHLASVSS